MAVALTNDIPPPPRGQGISHAIRTMEPGQSFFVACGLTELLGRENSIRSIASRERVSITIRTVPGGLRVWRNV